jgi:hypothetical protein
MRDEFSKQDKVIKMKKMKIDDLDRWLLKECLKNTALKAFRLASIILLGIGAMNWIL